MKKLKSSVHVLTAALISAALVACGTGSSGGGTTAPEPVFTNLSIFAGTGESGVQTPGLATSSKLNAPANTAVDSKGNVYIADWENCVVERVSKTGQLTVFAGIESATPQCGVESNNVAATASHLHNPSSLAVDANDNLYIADQNNFTIAKVAANGILTKFAGTGSSPAQGLPTPGPAINKSIYPLALAVDKKANALYFSSLNFIGKVDLTTESMSIFAGNGEEVSPTPGPALNSAAYGVTSLSVDSKGNVYASNTFICVITKITPAQQLSIYAGILPSPGGIEPGQCSSLETPFVPNLLAKATTLGNTGGIGVDAYDNLYVIDVGNSVVDKITPDGKLSVFAGKVGQFGVPTAGLATNATFRFASDNGGFGGVTPTSTGVYITATGNHMVTVVK